MGIDIKNSKVMAYHVDKGVHEKMRLYSFLRRQSVSETVREAIDGLLKKEKVKKMLDGVEIVEEYEDVDEPEEEVEK